MTADDDLRLAKMRELAEKVDQHKLTDIEAQFKYAEYDAAIRRRDAREIEQKEAFAEDQQATEAAIGALEAQAEASQRAQAQADILSAAAFFGAMSAPSRLPAGAYMLPSQLPSQSPTTICQTLANTTYCY
jgi:hypothetical protein